MKRRIAVAAGIVVALALAAFAAARAWAYYTSLVDADAATRATALARGISEAMNYVGLAVVLTASVATVSFTMWFVVRLVRGTRRTP